MFHKSLSKAFHIITVFAVFLLCLSVPAHAEDPLSSVLGADDAFSPNYAKPVGESANAEYFQKQREQIFKGSTEPPSVLAIEKSIKAGSTGGPLKAGDLGGGRSNRAAGSGAGGVAGGINDQALACYSWRLLAIVEGNFGGLIMAGAGIVVLIMCLTGNYRSIYSALGVIAISFVLRELVLNFYDLRTCDPQAVGGVFTTGG